MSSRLAFALASALLGCHVTGSFPCQTSDQCRRGGELGTCEPTGYCAFADPGRRYDDS